jgi:aminoglycoside/choline kinase family phosphotransferase
MKSKIIPIAGDASFRTFYRIYKNKKSKIIILAKKEKYKNLIVYAAINQYLRKNNILTPKLYFQNYKKGIFVIEDFGNLSFYKILLKKKNKLIIYKKLVDLLIKIQKIKIKSTIRNIIKGKYKIEQYSKKHLQSESDLFFSWYLPIFFSKKKTAKIKKKVNKILLKLYKKLNFPNSYFVHRDYHSQNLLKFGSKIGVIDTQDALIGNPAYDLASLIDDVRIKTSSKLKKQVFDYYLKNFKGNKEKFLDDFNTLSVQRNMKIIGIFSRLFKRDNKKNYTHLIPHAWKLLEMRLKTRKLKNLKKILDIYFSKNLRKRTVNN